MSIGWCLGGAVPERPSDAASSRSVPLGRVGDPRETELSAYLAIYYTRDPMTILSLLPATRRQWSEPSLSNDPPLNGDVGDQK